MSKVLVLTSRWPYPPYGGDRLRILEICRQLAIDHEVTIVALCDGKAPAPPESDAQLFHRIEAIRLPRWRSYLNSAIGLFSREPLQLAFYKSRAYKDVVCNLASQADVVVAHLIRTAQYIPEDFVGLKILEMTDAMSLSLSRGKKVGRVGKFLSFVYGVEELRVRVYEQRCLRFFDVVSLVSGVDKSYLEDSVPNAQADIVVATLGIESSRLSNGSDLVGNEIVFFGNMATLPNIDACDFFIRECLPLVLEQCPDVRFRIAGPVTPKVAGQLSGDVEGVEICGKVDDLREVAKTAFCGVAPMRRGAGIQTKILDYLALGLPCVTTDIGYEGLQAKIGEEILVANTPAEIAGAIVQLKKDSQLRRLVGRGGRRYVEDAHGSEKCLRPLVEAIDRHLGNPPQIN